MEEKNTESNRNKQGFFSDSSGNLSSKRFAGVFTMVIGCAIALFAVWREPETVEGVLWPIMISGGSLLGVSVLEKRNRD